MDTPEHISAAPGRHMAAEAALVFCCAILASLLGILTRPEGGLALFWPANALLLGLFLRCPQLAEIHGWLAATVGFFTADICFGTTTKALIDSPLLTSLWLTSANMLSIATAYLLFQIQPIAHRKLTRPSSILHLLLISVCAALAGAITGAGAAPFIIAQPSLSGFILWFSNELLNFIVILPALLTAPQLPLWRQPLRRLSSPFNRDHMRKLLPLFTLCAAVVLGIATGDPMAMTLLPLPALLWCAARYRTFVTALLILVLCIWLMTCVWPDFLSPVNSTQTLQIVLVRLLVALVFLCPLLLSTHCTFRRAYPGAGWAEHSEAHPLPDGGNN